VFKIPKNIEKVTNQEVWYFVHKSSVRYILGNKVSLVGISFESKTSLL